MFQMFGGRDHHTYETLNDFWPKEDQLGWAGKMKPSGCCSGMKAKEKAEKDKEGTLRTYSWTWHEQGPSTFMKDSAAGIVEEGLNQEVSYLVHLDQTMLQ